MLWDGDFGARALRLAQHVPPPPASTPYVALGLNCAFRFQVITEAVPIHKKIITDNKKTVVNHANERSSNPRHQRAQCCPCPFYIPVQAPASRPEEKGTVPDWHEESHAHEAPHIEPS